MTATARPHALPRVRLVPITRDNWREAISLRVRADQESFVPSVAISLAKALVRPDGPDDEHRPYAAVADGVMVGFGSLSANFGVAEILWIGGFLIDARFQGRGFGRAAPNAFVALARQEPSCRAVGLTVEPHNALAIRLYRSRGFEATGEMFDGELVHLLRLETVVAR